MSTAICRSERDVEHRGVLQEGVVAAEPVAGLLCADALAWRLRILDELDLILGAEETPAVGLASGVIADLLALRGRLEAVNRDLYEEARREIIREGRSRRLCQWLRDSASGGDVAARGLNFDALDEIVSGVLRLREPDAAEAARAPEMLAYQPTPARHIVDLSRRLSPGDVLVDLGSGLGHVPLVVSILSGNRTLGVEREPAYVACAQECARNLGLEQARFVAEDARMADLSAGTVFYLYTPFTGSILREVLARLQREGTKRRIRIFSLGPCTRVLGCEAWLKASGESDMGRIALFEAQ